ncbi:hypothetical protein [Streptomyces sp. NPDC094466]|uniref:hypothetical protein n=1 Tax=Streptomyces sp. NPDC094466 TaxID=3366065 RepID=UPI00382C3B11
MSVRLFSLDEDRNEAGGRPAVNLRVVQSVEVADGPSGCGGGGGGASGGPSWCSCIG